MPPAPSPKLQLERVQAAGRRDRALARRTSMTSAELAEGTAAAMNRANAAMARANRADADAKAAAPTFRAVGSVFQVRYGTDEWADVYDFAQQVGPKGDTGEAGAMPIHLWAGTSIAFQKPSGEMGAYVNLKGVAGDNAEIRVSGGYIQARTGAGAWANLVAVSSLMGSPGVGAAGTAATVSIGTVTTGAAGSNATVTNSGTSSAAVLDLTIPRGSPGTGGASFSVSVPVAVALTHGTPLQPNTARPCQIAVTARLTGALAVTGEVTLQVSQTAAFTAPVTVGSETLTLTLAALNTARTLTALVPAGYYVRTQSTGLVVGNVATSAIRWDL